MSTLKTHNIFEVDSANHLPISDQHCTGSSSKKPEQISESKIKPVVFHPDPASTEDNGNTFTDFDANWIVVWVEVADG